MGRSPASARAVSVALIVALCITVFAGSSALAGHLSDWTHDHSDAGVPPRPSGLAGLNNVFGARCSDRANNARSWWPNADTDPFGAGKYVYYHTYLARNIGYNIRTHINAAHRDGALYPGIGGYNCRLIDGSTSWSVHSWGAAVDTNWQRNPRYQTFWNGRGIDGENHGTYIPTCGGEASPAIASSGASTGTRPRIPCTSST